MAETKQFRNLTEYHNGNSAENNIKLSDVAPFQHENLATNTNKLGKMNMAQTFCEPVAICNSNSPADGAYTATCVNYPDFAVSYDDSHGTSHYLYGMKVRVIFTYGITYGSVDQGTYPTLSINGSGALPLLAQGKTMARGAISAGQSVEFTIIPYGNSIAFDADSNVRENTTDYTIYTDGNGRTNVVAANDLRSVTSGAVANAIIGKQAPFPGIPADANNVDGGGEQKITYHMGEAYPSNITNYPPVYDYDLSGGSLMLLLETIFLNVYGNRVVQYCTQVYYSTSSGWNKGRRWKRVKIDTTWFPWEEV